MWWTPQGERVLRGAEWELVREGLASLWDWIEMAAETRGSFDVGTEAFDRLQVGQKLALLALVGRALSDEATPRPALTVNTEAAVAAIFRQIAGQVEMEIDHLGGFELEDLAILDSPIDATHWRRLVLAAHRESAFGQEAEALARSEKQDGDTPEERPNEDEPDEPWSPPDVTSEDADVWEFLLACLAIEILWDDGDFDAGEAFLDADPAEAGARMELMGIAEDYYTDIAPDPTEEQLQPIRRMLRSLCGRTAPKEPEIDDAVSPVKS